MSPTARSLAWLRDGGWTAGVVERWNPGARVRQDFLGFADIVAVHVDDRRTAAVQACVTGDVSKRVTKIIGEPRATTWLRTGHEIIVMGWAKRGPRGKRKTWQLHERAITLDDIAPAEEVKP